MNFIFNFFHNYLPSPIIFKLGPFVIHWYGLLIVIAISIGFLLINNFGRKHGIRKDDIFNLSIYLIIFGFLGARIYHVLSEMNYYLQHPLEIFYIWQGGLGIFGIIIADILVLFFYSRKHKLPFWLLSDIFIPAFVIGEAIGRLGNWFNQENFGRPTNLPWGIPISLMNRPLEYLNNEYFQPCFLYQLLWNIFIFVILLVLIKKINFGSGKIFAAYLISYPIGRFLIEILRVNYQPIIFGLRLAQIVTILMFIGGWLILIKRFKKRLFTGNSQVIH